MSTNVCVHVFHTFLGLGLGFTDKDPWDQSRSERERERENCHVEKWAQSFFSTLGPNPFQGNK